MSGNHPDFDLVPYLRGELSADERTRVERHLEECADCRKLADSSVVILSKLAQAIDEVRPPDWNVYRAELRRKLAEKQAEGRDAGARWWRRELRLPELGWPSMALTAVAVAVLAIAIGMHRWARMESPEVDQLAMEQEMNGADVGLLANYRVVENLDLLENYELIEHLDELTPGDRQSNETPS
jgi:anti-sigma-K factor RskA